MDGGSKQSWITQTSRAAIHFKRIFMELQDVIDRQKDGRDHESASLLNARRCAASIFLDSSRTRRECSAARSMTTLPSCTFNSTWVASSGTSRIWSNVRSK